jgi:cyclophilin family peptidyl-prolyl cis-trans isomerase
VHRPAVLLATVALALGAAACGSDDEEPAAGADAATPTATAETQPGGGGAAQAGCEPVEAPAPQPEQERRTPELELDPDVTYTATLQTNCGDVEIQLAVKDAPKTTASFVALARAGFYDGLTFHRISAPGGQDFVVQAGDPLGTGNGGPGYSVTEAPPEGVQYTRGVVAMAKTQIEDPGTSGSQFFIVTAEDSGLPPEYAVLGEVSDGDDAVSRIAAVPADPATEMPVDPVVISAIEIEESGG